MMSLQGPDMSNGQSPQLAGEWLKQWTPEDGDFWSTIGGRIAW